MICIDLKFILKNNSVLFTPPIVTSPKSQQAAEKIADKKVKVTIVPGDGKLISFNSKINSYTISNIC